MEPLAAGDGLFRLSTGGGPRDETCEPGCATSAWPPAAPPAASLAVLLEPPSTEALVRSRLPRTPDGSGPAGCCSADCPATPLLWLGTQPWAGDANGGSCRTPVMRTRVRKRMADAASSRPETSRCLSLTPRQSSRAGQPRGTREAAEGATLAAEPRGQWSPANSSARTAGGARTSTADVTRRRQSRGFEGDQAIRTAVRHLVVNTTQSRCSKACAPPERHAAQIRCCCWSCQRRNAPATRRSFHQLVEGAAVPRVNSHWLWRGPFPGTPPLDRRSGSGGNGVRRHSDGSARLRRRPVGRSRNRRCSSPRWGASPLISPRR